MNGEKDKFAIYDCKQKKKVRNIDKAVYYAEVMNGKLYFYLRDIRPERVVALCALPDFKVRLTVNAGDKPSFALKLKPGENPLEAGKKLIKAYGEGGKA